MIGVPCTVLGHPPRLVPRFAETGKIFSHPRHRRAIAHAPGHPGARHVAEDRAPDGEPFHHLMRGGDLEARPQVFEGRVQAQDHDAPTMRIVGIDGGAGLLPGRIRHHRLQFPPVWENPDGVESLDDGGRRRIVYRSVSRRDDLQQEVQPVGAGGLGQPLDCRFLVGAQLRRIVRTIVAERLHHVLGRPLRQRRAEVVADLHP